MSDIEEVVQLRSAFQCEREAHQRTRELYDDVKAHYELVAHSDLVMQAALRQQLTEAQRERGQWRDAANLNLKEREEYRVEWDKATHRNIGLKRECDKLAALKAQRCGNCADWRRARNGQTPTQSGYCVSSVSRCAAVNDGDEYWQWPADHGCPSHRPKGAK